MDAESSAEVLIQGIGNGNRIVVNDQGGVITVFGDARKSRLFQETYQLEPKEIEDLVNVLHKHDPVELMKYIPAPVLVDMSVAVTRGKMTPRQFLDHKEDFELDRRYMNGYRQEYILTARASNGVFREPQPVEVFEAQKEAAHARSRGRLDLTEKFSQAIGDEAKPLEVKQVESTNIPGVPVF